MMRACRLLSVLAILGGMALLSHDAQAEAPSFEPGACALPGVTAEIAPRLRCGIVRVPRDHARQDGATYALAVVVIRSAILPARPDPVIYVSGGPGSPLTIHAAYQARQAYAPARDLILVDQRGTGRSEPQLCPDAKDGLFDAALAVVSTNAEAALAARQSAYAACRDEAVRRGYDLADFGTQVTARDLDQVRQALGVERWNIYGKSYGTVVATTLAALQPQTVRSLVLESPYPPEPMPLFSDNVQDALHGLLALCASQAACARA